MTVKQLIKELKKMPPDTTVAFRDFDQSITEINCLISRVDFQDFSETNRPCYGAYEDHEIKQGKYVIIS